MPSKMSIEPAIPANNKSTGVHKNLLYSGSRFRGCQKSKGNSYEVEVVLQVVFMFISSLTYCAHLSNYLGSLNTKSFVSPRDLTGQSLIDFQGLALSKNAISLWFFMFHLFCV